ncbi:hypothetical protein NC653_022722 [Populus alba x Populus x berolinensis]|uniref:Uncharacterized protein n=1 Tax=Populus alba x Populus x berolinensis TaxID=444605 RepID=A0AAD6MHT6_9ROSI|nr:hypothetical protein NC653_022722 [Populus alba x Populus x berolinensis]
MVSFIVRLFVSFISLYIIHSQNDYMLFRLGLPDSLHSHILFDSSTWHNCLFQGSNLARLPPPESAIELFVTNNKGFDYGCSGFIFSWHMIFTIVFVHTYHRYGILLYTRTGSHFCWQYLAHNCSCIKQLAWLLAVVQTFLSLASCKHFTVHVFVSW